MERGCNKCARKHIENIVRQSPRGARQLQDHNAAVAAMWAIAPGHDSIVALNRGYGAHSSDDLTLDQDALARNEIDAMVAMPAMVNEGNGAIVEMVAMGGAFHTRRVSFCST